MSQIEHQFRALLSKQPEIEKCYQAGLLNRRSLARYLIRQGIAQSNQLEAVIAMLRRFPFAERKNENKNLFSSVRTAIKDNIVIIDFQKNKELLKALQLLIGEINYDTGETFKVIVGSSSLSLVLDQEKEKATREIFDGFKVKNRMAKLSELSLLFPSSAIKSKGILSAITREFSLNDIIITEFLTASSELLIYLSEEQALKAYQLVKSL